MWLVVAEPFGKSRGFCWWLWSCEGFRFSNKTEGRNTEAIEETLDIYLPIDVVSSLQVHHNCFLMSFIIAVKAESNPLSSGDAGSHAAATSRTLRREQETDRGTPGRSEPRLLTRGSRGCPDSCTFNIQWAPIFVSQILIWTSATSTCVSVTCNIKSSV